MVDETVGEFGHVMKKSNCRKRRRAFVGIFDDSEEDDDLVAQQTSQFVYQHYQELLRQLQEEPDAQQIGVQPNQHVIHSIQGPSHIQTPQLPMQKSVPATQLPATRIVHLPVQTKSIPTSAPTSTQMPRAMPRPTIAAAIPVVAASAVNASLPAVTTDLVANNSVLSDVKHDVAHLLPAFVETTERLFRSNFKAVELRREVERAEKRLAAAAENLKKIKAKVESHECEMSRLADAVKAQSLPINKADKLDLALGIAARNLVESLVRGPSTAHTSKSFATTDALPAWLQNWSHDDPWWAVPDWIRDVMDCKKPMLSTTKLKSGAAMLSTRKAVEAHLIHGVSISSASQSSGVHRRLLGRLCKMADAQPGPNTPDSIHRCLVYIRVLSNKVNAVRKQKKQQQSAASDQKQTASSGAQDDGLKRGKQ